MNEEPRVGMRVFYNNALVRIDTLSECKRYCIVSLVRYSYSKYKISCKVSDLKTETELENYALKNPKQFIAETTNLGKPLEDHSAPLC